MAKGKNETSPAGDYIEQLQWRSRHGRRWPVLFEPKWKYKIVYRYPPTSLFHYVSSFVLLLGVGFIVVSLLSSADVSTGAKIFFASVIGLIFIIIFFAVKDGAVDTDEKSDD